MKNFKTIKEYCEAIHIPAPKYDLIDIRSFEEKGETLEKMSLAKKKALTQRTTNFKPS